MVELSHPERKSTHFGEKLTDILWRLARDLGLSPGADRAVDQNLRRLDDRLLADIGLRRDQASGAVEELPERLTAEPMRPVRTASDRASDLGSYRNLWRA